MPTFAPHLPAPRPSYSQARENLVRAIPSKLLCLLACGGKDCRYEGPNCWKLNQQVIRGLFSSWVTDDIIAMTRPSNFLIQKCNIINQFQRLNVRSIINMQLPGEHAHCGPPLDPESGFTYSPQIFMENDIYFYNFGMPDFGVSSIGSFINAVKVLAFAVTEGKVAVHCHAGLGRTGVLIACYLIYTLRLSPSEAIHFVRIKRPCSIQTRAQISQVFAFARLLGAQLVQYPDDNLRHGAPFTLQHYLNRQALLLHGQEARRLRHTPKVVYLLCLRLSCLALGLSSPPEIYQELERRSALRTLSGTVRETLMAQHYVALLSEGHKDSGSMSSWEELHVRKGDVLVFRRSYSDSYLSKVTQDEELELGDLSPFNGVLLSEQQKTTRQDSNKLNNPDSSMRVSSSSSTKRFKGSAINVLHKCSSSTKVCRIQPNQGRSSAARAVAKAMGEQGSPGETVTQRSALLQGELNSSDCGWALLVTESDPDVLCCLLWTWLENLKEPVLSVEDIEKMRVGVFAKKPSISVLKKVKKQDKNMSCLDKKDETSLPGTETHHQLSAELCEHSESSVSTQRGCTAPTPHTLTHKGTTV
uniref:Protein tyrosine phosphatase domain-containing protein 1 n=1 Tax=Gouania willdenowi TaxID=441366 RepID=A0A8C5H4E9_GOUWI